MENRVTPKCAIAPHAASRGELHRRSCRRRRNVYGARQPDETAACQSTRLRDHRRGRGGEIRSTGARCAGREEDRAGEDTGDSLEAGRRLAKPGVALRGVTSDSQFHRREQAPGLLAAIRSRHGTTGGNPDCRCPIGRAAAPGRIQTRRFALRSRWRRPERVVPHNKHSQWRPATTRTRREPAQAGRGAVAVAPRSLDLGDGRHAYRTISFLFSRAFAAGEQTIKLSEVSR